MTQNNLGAAYLTPAKQGDVGAIGKAIYAAENALSVYTDEHHSHYFENATRLFADAHALRDKS